MQRLARRLVLPSSVALLASQLTPQHISSRSFYRTTDLGIIDGVTVNSDNSLTYKGIRCDVTDNTLPHLNGYQVGACAAIFLFLCFWFRAATLATALISGKDAIGFIGHKYISRS